MPALAVSAHTATSALGRGLDAHEDALRRMRGGLAHNNFSSAPLDCWIGRVAGLEAATLPATLNEWECRNNRLAWMGLQQDRFMDAVHRAASRYGSDRIAVLLGTSTGSIASTEQGYRHLDVDGRLPAEVRRPIIHCLHSLSAFARTALELSGPCLTVSTACSSSAKVYAMATRMMQADLIDAAVVGGTDTLCDSVLFGFNSLGLVSQQACRPFDIERDGISIGEAAGFALLERAERAPDATRLAGYGESSDAHHMSTPHPEGLGAERAMRDALARAGLRPEQVDYINLHGTSTRKNDEVEAALIARLFPDTTRSSSTKGYTGHTLGAAGALEASIALLALERSLLPGNLGCDTPDPLCEGRLQQETRARNVRVALSNSFGFGGNNACLAFVRAEEAA
ncbi:beta-ketoacyl-[acyl-carrier-protein] synthase family protein [Oleiagrimonas citrea]|uniref:Beta-ketoacyl-[acyl-carrier-protein] synthase family protein n=1 Tax=Oleiagrimonas citrea TaxID=1665687 RepID=A0A846ZNU9_9GAMM|nr:beta-ketoacyl-[acyl-carrier-protein] synthase family protein [Oleiagrimonas citrea]NKZ39874.1 beta-ketoacyl-[acyl-carrier-protein] synthase family protein [Oleiagrimonas citrea]